MWKGATGCLGCDECDGMLGIEPAWLWPRRRRAEAAARAGKQADGVIVGSAVVKHIIDGDINGGIQLIAAMRKALDA